MAPKHKLPRTENADSCRKRKRQEGETTCFEKVPRCRISDDQSRPEMDNNSLDIESHLTEASWTSKLQQEFSKPYFKNLQEKLQSEYESGVPVYPPRESIFAAFELTPFNEVKVVILGQEPYSNEDQACGLAFSVNESTKIPPSLNNIFKELQREGFITEKPKCGSLEKWAKAGVFLLNTSLTVGQDTKGKKKTHRLKKYGWQTFTDYVIQVLSDKPSGIVFMLWGNEAQKNEKLINTSRHRVVKAPHPSPLASASSKKTGKSFLDSNCFMEANRELVDMRKTGVDWGIIGK